MLTGRNAVCPIMTEGSVCQCTALHRKAQCTGLIAPLLAHFQPQLKPHHTPGGKEKEGLKYLRGLRVWSNDIRHGPIEENLTVTFKVSSPLLLNHRKRSHLWLRFGCKWGTWECSLLGDMIQMFRRQVSYAAQPSRGAYTAPGQREDKGRHPRGWGGGRGLRLVDRLSRGHVGPRFTHFTLWKGQSQNPQHAAQTVSQLVQGDVRKGLLRCKMVQKQEVGICYQRWREGARAFISCQKTDRPWG